MTANATRGEPYLKVEVNHPPITSLELTWSPQKQDFEKLKVHFDAVYCMDAIAKIQDLVFSIISPCPDFASYPHLPSVTHHC